MPSGKVSSVPLGVVKRSAWFTYELADQMENPLHEKEQTRESKSQRRCNLLMIMVELIQNLPC